MNIRHRKPALPLLLGLGLVASACDSNSDSPGGPDGGDGSTDADGGDTGDGPDAAPDSDGGGGGGEANYLLHSAVTTTDNRTNYFTLVDSLSAEQELSYDQSLELPGRARLYAQQGSDFFAIGDSESLDLTRYEVADGELVAGDSFSLQPFGVSSLGAQAVLFVSQTKAYYKDSGQAQIIVWNPEEMAVDDAIELPESLIKDGYNIGVGDWVSREGEAFFTVSWYTPEYDRVLEGTALVRIDTETNEVTVTEDERCRGLATAGEVNDTLYFFSDIINGFGHAVYPDDGGQQDCFLRIQPGETEFDDEFVGTLSTAIPETHSGAAMTLTADGQIWAQAVDLSEAPSEPGSTYGEWYGGGWTWWTADLDSLDSDAEEIEGEAGAYSSFILPADEGFFISQTAADYSETTLMDIGGGEPTPGIAFPGFTLDIAEL